MVSLRKLFTSFCTRVNIVAAFDHSGRAGNGFFLSLFDSHPQVLTCPCVHYIYSYVLRTFGDRVLLGASEAKRFLIETSYFRFIFTPPVGDAASYLIKCGADPSFAFDREAALATLDALFETGKPVSRRELILAGYFSYARGIGRDVEIVDYILVSDAISLPDEPLLQDFGGRTVKAVVHDFPVPKLISLVRDPRAVFASVRHQYVNSQGNIYDLTPGRYLQTMKDLWQENLCLGRGCVYLVWLVYLATSGRTIYRLKQHYASFFETVRNEDINLNFLPTMEGLCHRLGISELEDWRSLDYVPTMMGIPWKGTGAYNSNYQPVTKGLLKNDPQEVASRVTGPNAYVTSRWKTRLSLQEIRLIEVLFRQEMQDLGYDFLHASPEASKEGLLISLYRPFQGELPSLAWLIEGMGMGKREGVTRFFYALTFLPFFFMGRLVLSRLHRKGFFENHHIGLACATRHAKV